MPRFTALQSATGFDPLRNFLVVGEGRSSFLLLHDARVENLKFDATKLDVRAVTRTDYSRYAHVLQDQFMAWGLVAEESARGFAGAMHAAATYGGLAHLLSVRGKVRSQSRIRATRRGVTAELHVAVVPQKMVTVAFRFVQHRDASGAMITLSRWTPYDRRRLSNMLNWVYGPQLNVTFDVVDADWARVDQHLGHPIDDEAFLRHIVGKKHPSADLTVFFLGNGWKSQKSEVAGTMFYEEGAAVVVDDSQIPVTDGADRFAVTLAHEVAHYLRDAQSGFRGHHDRPGVLLSGGTESTVLDKQLVYDMNPPPA
ncbi:hypothetical protein [Roseisolibacter agri]|uniref:Uncharacterized protein n=1 Tax=Roseisolibacter agri TaxID=2014610 RepID=A0AA37Q521_9BACT|nr:hypothetical protein [Roseisolibacter agri]GLC24757.1 hypothetical protein rosag_12700 [Roseisolibacter agri]